MSTPRRWDRAGDAGLWVALALAMLLAGCAPPPGGAPLPPTPSAEQRRPGQARDPVEQKIASVLLADLRSPDAHGLRLLDITTAVPPATSAAVVERGGALVGPEGRDTLRAWLPVEAVLDLAARPEVGTVKPASMAVTS